MDDLLQEFIAETRETLEALSGEIVAWEAHPEDSARLDAIFRFVHTVKGSCGFLDLPRLGRLSHAAEDVLAQVRAGDRAPDRALVNAVLSVVDRIGELVEAIESGASLEANGDELLIAALAEGTQEVAQASGPAAQRSAARSVRLNVDLLDRMMSGMSDMVLARNELARRLRNGDIDPAIEAALERLSMTVGEMRDTVTRTRMQKIDALFSALPRMVRDTAAGLSKSVMLHIDGSDVELDREMIEVMRDPLVHIIRNSIDHGIEAPQQRRAAGKRENGRLSVSARQSGNQIIVEIADDGRGIDTEKLIAKLVASGRDEQQLRRVSDRAKLGLIFEPGLSSKDEVTEVSGRGVGMDVVRAAIEQIGGRIELDSVAGKGLRITIHVPLTLSIISAIVVGVGSQRFAISRQAIEEIVTERSDAIRIDTLGSTRIATVRDRRMPLVDLSGLLGIEQGQSDGGRMLAIVSVSDGSYALAVDTVLDNEELVVKPASPAVMSTGVYAGQTLPDSGLPMLMLDCAGMAHVAGLDFSREAVEAFEEEAQAVEPSGLPALLFVDLDGARRAVPLAAVDRVEQVDGMAVRYAAGRFRVTIDGRILPLAAQGALDGRERLSVLRLKDGDNEVSYAIDEALDIILLPEDMVPAREPGPVAGLALVEGEQIELLDILWVFDEHADRGGNDGADAPLCLIAGDSDGWMTSFVRPLLETAGYRVVTALAPGEAPAVVLTPEEGAPAETAKAPLVRLRRRRAASGANDDSVYRYDRAGLLCAMEARMAGGRLN
ncbi:chemotaxis protein CheA [Sphingomonas xinjiangensis]|uniref:Chemotaxis protein CheA n=1 Tax=Sphingomonas xinjiangensis TaxID=643568 RepID=A0A840YJE8_9SPHN|nr:chemotaxis protein CheA [Sphingomonas xinjiangensis]MBB5708890.1 two-component system chemotaxis sensor kinase CheA [Sphingomonas xinjiangensis]